MSKELLANQLEVAPLDWIAEHRRMYLESGGVAGHIMDLRGGGGYQFTTTLLLETVGRKSGQNRITPLIYGDIGGEVVIVASKGGAEVHPAWYLNIKGSNEVSFQIGTQAFRASWREPHGAERAAVWSFMARIYPLYESYQSATDREIPLVMLSAKESIDIFKPLWINSDG